MSTPKDYSGYADSDFLETIAHITNQVKQRSYDLMQIQQGHSVLDVGCGPATDTITLALLVSSTGEVIGVDYDEEMINKADQKAREANVARWVIHKHADATSLPFEDGYFDSCRSERLFQHLLQPEQVLSEMIRVTKSGGGWVVVADTDPGATSVDTPEVDIERRLIRLVAEKLVNNGYAGRHLYRQFKRQGLQDISIELAGIPVTNYTVLRQGALLERFEKLAFETGTITQEELERWHTSLEQADAEGVFYASVIQVMVVGRKL